MIQDFFNQETKRHGQVDHVSESKQTSEESTQTQTQQQEASVQTRTTTDRRRNHNTPSGHPSRPANNVRTSRKRLYQDAVTHLSE